MTDFFKDKKIWFYDLGEIIKEYVRNCPVCIQTVKTVHRLEPCKAITVNGPGQKYEFDLIYLNDD